MCRKCGGRKELTWEVVPKAGLGADHPLRTGLTEDGDSVLGLLAQNFQSPAKMAHGHIHVLVGEPAVLSKNQLQKRTIQISLIVQKANCHCELHRLQ